MLFDQSYNATTIASTLKKGDFRGVPPALRDNFRNETVDKAKKSAQSIFSGLNPISAFHLKKKPAYKIKKIEDDLVVRKLSSNLKRLTRYRSRGRSFVISNLRSFLEEGVPYRVYRLDVKSFYESFSIDEIKTAVSTLRWLTPLSKRHLTALLEHYVAIGGTGLPRGMGISALLSDWLMSRFDAKMLDHPAVYFYGRYVDDITIVTNLSETQIEFLKEVTLNLPEGLKLNEHKTQIHSSLEKTKPQKPPSIIPLPKFSFSYLGYEFTVLEPLYDGKTNKPEFRLVRIEIAPQKVNKIKSRIVRSFVAFKNTNDFSLLLARMKYLTSNFDIVDKNTGKRKLSGIFYSYPLLSDDAETLSELDLFLRGAILSKKGRLFSLTAPMLSNEQKRKLLALRFVHGHETRSFIHFAPAKIKQIQECWINE